jgi:stage III sporulation protein AF
MMDWIREWIMSVTATSVLLAAVQTLIPKGGVKKVGELACGLLLLLSVSTPLVKLDADELAITLTEFRMQELDVTKLLEIQNTELVKEIIEEKTAAYISDKAAELGLDCTAKVTYEYSRDGQAYPSSVWIKGNWSEEQKEKLTARIEYDLAIPKEKQTYEKEYGE